jgi:hypothetical protein
MQRDGKTPLLGLNPYYLFTKKKQKFFRYTQGKLLNVMNKNVERKKKNADNKLHYKDYFINVS